MWAGANWSLQSLWRNKNSGWHRRYLEAVWLRGLTTVTNGPCQFTATPFWSCITATAFPLPRCKWPKEMPGSGKLSPTWIFQILWVVTGRQCCLQYMVQYLSVHLDAEALRNKRCRENWICLQLHCAGTVHRSTGSWMGTMGREGQGDRVKKDRGCSGVPQRQREKLFWQSRGRSLDSTARSAGSGEQEGASTCDAAFYSSFCQLLLVFLSLLKIVTCWNKLLARMSQLRCLLLILAVTPVAKLCWVNQLPPPTSGRKHNPGCSENNKLWLISSSETLQYVMSMPHYANLQSPGTKRELISI